MEIKTEASLSENRTLVFAVQGDGKNKYGYAFIKNHDNNGNSIKYIFALNKCKNISICKINEAHDNIKFTYENDEGEIIPMILSIDENDNITYIHSNYDELDQNIKLSNPNVKNSIGICADYLEGKCLQNPDKYCDECATKYRNND
jgi:hypothetical protein